MLGFSRWPQADTLIIYRLISVAILLTEIMIYAASWFCHRRLCDGLEVILSNDSLSGRSPVMMQTMVFHVQSKTATWSGVSHCCSGESWACQQPWSSSASLSLGWLALNIRDWYVTAKLLLLHITRNYLKKCQLLHFGIFVYSNDTQPQIIQIS